MGRVHIAVDSDPRIEFAQALRNAGCALTACQRWTDTSIALPSRATVAVRAAGPMSATWTAGRRVHIQNFRTGIKTDWKSSGQVTALDASDRARMAAEAAQKRHDRAAEREQQYEGTAQKVEAIWTAATPVQAHLYLADKGVQSHGLRQGSDEQTITVQDRDGTDREVSIAGRLLVPVADANGRMTSLQFIDPTSSKMFMPNSRVEGGHFVIGDTQQPGPLLIAEGYATAATLHELTGMAAVVAFNAGNLMPGCTDLSAARSGPAHLHRRRQ